MKRYLVLTASVLIQFCFGSVYAWSVFVPALRESFGFSATQTQLIFGTAVASFGAMFVFSGYFYRKLGPRLLIISGALFFVTGYVLASFSDGVFVRLWLGMGLLAGVAVGLGYLAPLVACMHWFPQQRGLITGICVGGFGAGAILVSSLAEHMLTAGMNVLVFWRIMGITYSAVIILCSLFVSLPKDAAEEEKHAGVPLRDLLRMREYWGMTIGLFAGTFAGLLIIGSLKPIGMENGLTSAMATTGVCVFAIGNASGRVIAGWVYDRLGRITIPIALLWMSLWVFLLVPSTKWEILYKVVAICIGIGFGSAFVVFLARVAESFGKERVSSVYPIVYAAYVVSGTLGPAAGGLLRDSTNSYTSAVMAAAFIPLLGAVITCLMLCRRRSALKPV
jgi:OFA family oxalate/formate antiporter-like MFS transporter